MSLRNKGIKYAQLWTLPLHTQPIKCKISEPKVSNNSLLVAEIHRVNHVPNKQIFNVSIPPFPPPCFRAVFLILSSSPYQETPAPAFIPSLEYADHCVHSEANSHRAEEDDTPFYFSSSAT